jgi:hypothetical protein
MEAVILSRLSEHDGSQHLGHIGPGFPGKELDDLPVQLFFPGLVSCMRLERPGNPPGTCVVGGGRQIPGPELLV